jgi:uncharacterized protein YndB with AHSA1/START domain
MSANIIATSTVEINAPASSVWDALTNPEMIEKYLFGTKAKSEWKVGSPIEYSGEYEGKSYHDKGEILQMLPEKLFQHTYFSSMSGLEDKPENYANVSYELDEENGKTKLTVRQENVQSEEAKVHSEKNWKTVLNTLKELLERKKVRQEA